MCPLKTKILLPVCVRIPVINIFRINLVDTFLSSTLIEQVVNGFFWATKPVVNHSQKAAPSTALGVSSYTVPSVVFTLK